MNAVKSANGDNGFFAGLKGINRMKNLQRIEFNAQI